MPHRLRERYPPTNAVAAATSTTTTTTSTPTPTRSATYRERFRSWNSARGGLENDPELDASSPASLATRPSPLSSSRSSSLRFGSWRRPSVSSGAAATPGGAERRAPVLRRKVRVSDRELVRRALQADAQQSLAQALDRPLAGWASAQHTREFTILSGPKDASRSSSGGGGGADVAHEVLAVGHVACSPQELAAVLRTADESQLNASMRALHGGRFIYGSVVHVVGPPHSVAAAEREQEQEQKQERLRPGDQLAVKTNCFVRSRLLGRNEQWCFLEHFQRGASASDGFTVVRRSMRARELAAGKAAPGRRVEQLQGVTTVFRVEQVAGQPPKGSRRGAKPSPAVRVTFHALYSQGGGGGGDADELARTHTIHEDEDEEQGEEAAVASAKTTKARLQALVESVRKLPAVVRRRRLGSQVFADTAAMGEARNARCISCTRSLRLLALTVKRRCQLCSYNVCAACCSSEKVETYNGHAATMTICRRCLECVDRCDYTHIQLGRSDSEYILEDDLDEEDWDVEQQDRKSVDIGDDGELSGPSVGVDSGAEPDAKQSPPVRARPAGASVVETLRQELSSEETKEAAMTVIQHLLDTRSEEDADEVDGAMPALPEAVVEVATAQTPESVHRSNSSSSSSSSPCSDESEGWQRRPGSPEEGVSAVEAYFRRRDHELSLGSCELASCELANAARRNYPIDIDADGAKPVAPVPSNEAERLRVIERLQLMALSAPMQELDIICEVLSLEIGLFCTMVTIVGETDQLVLACTLKGLVMASLPREHTFCQHLLMGDKPFVVNHPEADVRFYNMNPITQNGVQFYCGIPITSDGGLVVGSICCLNLQPVQLTRSQFSTLTKFGRIASRIIMARAKQQARSRATSAKLEVMQRGELDGEEALAAAASA